MKIRAASTQRTRALRASILASLLALGACGPLALEPAAQPSTFESDWHLLSDRTWIGERHWANRLQDWRVTGGSVECVEARPAFGMRTLHVLTHRLDETGEGSFKMTVRVEAADGDRDGSAAGFLVGAGGRHVDYSVTSQVHGTSAEDGGFLALLGSDGRVAFADFEQPVEGGGQSGWVMDSHRSLDDFPRLAEGVTHAGDGFDAAGPAPVILELVGASFDSRRTLAFTARSAETGAVLSSAYWEAVPPSVFDGAVAVFSHRGPEGSDLGYRFSDWRLAGRLVRVDAERAFGPIMFVHYTLDVQPNGSARLGMTAQAGPLGPEDASTATLEIAGMKGSFEEVAEAHFALDSATFHFSVEGLDPSRAQRFRVRYAPTDSRGEEVPGRVSYYAGEWPAEPLDGELTIAVLNCQKSYTGGLHWNGNGLWFPHREVRDHVAAHEPDLLYFAGDQIYEGDLSPAVGAPFERSMNDYLHKWYRHGLSFGELTRRLPSVVVPDDHDVYHGNIWGNAGVRMEGPKGTSAQDSGGYTRPPAFVNAVHRTQVGHLPPTADDVGTLANGITTYHTDLSWGGGSFAILDDRMYKSPPAILVPEGEVKNGWFQAEGFDPATSADVPGAVLLGASQEAFLADWASDWHGSWFKACLSQTPFAGVATIPLGAAGGGVIPSLKVPKVGEYVSGDKRAADTDTNGWPQTARDRGVALLRRAGAFHLTGDQHLGSTLRYGIDEFDDAGFVLSSPAVANTWPRRWFPNPDDRQPGPLVAPGAPDYTGRYFDGFGNRMTVHAVANPRAMGIEPERLHARAPGYGIVRVIQDATVKGGGHVLLEAWPRHMDPAAPDAAPYAGWPVSFALGDGDGRVPVGYLPTLELELAEGETAAVEVSRFGQGGDEVVYCRPAVGKVISLPIFERLASYSVRVMVTARAQGSRKSEGASGDWQWSRPGLRVQDAASEPSLVVSRPR